MSSGTSRKTRRRPICESFYNQDGECLHCGLQIKNRDKRFLEKHGHHNGSCLFKRSRFNESARPVRRARQGIENHVESTGIPPSTRGEEEDITDGVSPLPPQEGTPADMDTEPEEEDTTSSDSEYTENGSSTDEDDAISLERDDSSSEDDLSQGGDLGDCGGGQEDLSEAAAAVEDGFPLFPPNVDKSRPPRTVEDYRGRLNDPIYEGAETTLVEWLVESVELRGNTSRDAFERTWNHHVQHYRQPNICPTSWHMCKNVLGIEHFSDHVHHFCPCGQYRYGPCKGSRQKNYYSCKEQKCPMCGEDRFKLNNSGDLAPQRWAFYIPLDLVIKWYFFANPDFNEAVGKGRPSVDPQSSSEEGESEASGSTFATGFNFWGSPAHNAINDYFEKNGPDESRVLESRNNSPYSIFVDFFQPWKKGGYSTGAVLLKCEDMTLEDRGRLEFSPVIMIIPGPKKPPFAAPYLDLIAADFEKYSLKEQGILIDKAVKRVEDGSLTRVDPFYHRPVLIGLDADTPAGQWVLEAVQSSTGFLSCFKCKINGQQVNLKSLQKFETNLFCFFCFLLLQRHSIFEEI